MACCERSKSLKLGHLGVAGDPRHGRIDSLFRRSPRLRVAALSAQSKCSWRSRADSACSFVIVGLRSSRPAALVETDPWVGAKSLIRAAVADKHETRARCASCSAV